MPRSITTKVADHRTILTCVGACQLASVAHPPGDVRYRRRVAFQHVILALLESGPSHGWEMKSRIEAALGPEYGGLNKGYIYEVIHRMEREATIVSHIETQEGLRPDRSVHEITDYGREQLTEWLAEPVRPTAGFRDE